MSRGHSWLLGMKTQCMRTKSSTAGSTREPEGRESHRKQGNQKVQKTVKVPFNSFSIHPSSLHNYSAFELVSGLSLATIHLSLTAHSFCNIYASFLFTWFTVMYVHPHRLQEVLKDLLWCSWYHSVPAMNERRCDAFYKHTKTHTRIYLFYCAFLSACARLLTHTLWFPVTWCEDSFLTPAQLVHVPLNAPC